MGRRRGDEGWEKGKRGGVIGEEESGKEEREEREERKENRVEKPS